ncbi:MAG: DUF2927 domain-containing protein [Alphaproteobacteria bacterium]|nr:DUF2927 domain-containing protein [Alphaproteobacteria bacterium]
MALQRGTPGRITARPISAGRGRRIVVAAALAAAAWLAPAGASFAEPAEIARARAAERKSFTDAEIVEGFLKVTLGAELRAADSADRIRKYDRPVRVYIDNRARPNRRKQVEAALADIGRRIGHLDIAVTPRRKDANMLVTLVRDRDLARTIRSFYGAERAREILKSLEPQCLSGIRRDEQFRILHSDVFIVADAGEFIFYDCAYEEILQALGPINDDSSVPWTMFKDDVHMGFFGLYDQYILNILYDPRIRPGMTRDEVRAALPQVLPDVRAWVAKVNGIAK